MTSRGAASNEASIALCFLDKVAPILVQQHPALLFAECSALVRLGPDGSMISDATVIGQSRIDIPPHSGTRVRIMKP